MTPFFMCSDSVVAASSSLSVISKAKKEFLQPLFCKGFPESVIPKRKHRVSFLVCIRFLALKTLGTGIIFNVKRKS